MRLSEIKLEKDDQNNIKLVLPSEKQSEIYLTNYNFGLLCLTIKNALSNEQWLLVVEQIKEL